MRNKAGYCCLCGTEIYHIKRVKPDGDTQKIGRPYEEARRVTMVQVSGKLMSVTMCDECAEGCRRHPEVLKQVHRNVLEAFEHELEHLRRTNEEMAKIRREITKIVNDPPIGVVSIEELANA